MFRVVVCLCVCVCVRAFVSVGRSFGARACMFSFPTTTFRTIGIVFVIINTIVIIILFFYWYCGCSYVFSRGSGLWG